MIEAGWAPGLGHFTRLFKDQTAAYLRTLTRTCRPRAIAVCMLYYLDETPGGSWADSVLQKLNYNKDPEKLQLMMRKLYEVATSKVAVGDIPIVPVPLFEALDGKTSADYAQRVEPSVEGGRKLARLIMERLEPLLAAKTSTQVPHESAGGDGEVAVSTTDMPAAVHNKGK